jgi:hypothetical protein
MMERALTANYVTDWTVLEEDSVQYDKETIPYVYKAILHIQSEKGSKYEPSAGEINRVVSYMRASQ